MAKRKKKKRKKGTKCILKSSVSRLCKRYGKNSAKCKKAKRRKCK